MFKGFFGISIWDGEDTAVIADYVREQKRERRQNANIVEVGIRRDVTNSLLVAVGAGAGIGEESERYRLTASFQYSF